MQCRGAAPSSFSWELIWDPTRLTDVTKSKPNDVVWAGNSPVDLPAASSLSQHWTVSAHLYCVCGNGLEEAFFFFLEKDRPPSSITVIHCERDLVEEGSWEMERKGRLHLEVGRLSLTSLVDTWRDSVDCPFCRPLKQMESNLIMWDSCWQIRFEQILGVKLYSSDLYIADTCSFLDRTPANLMKAQWRNGICLYSKY